MDVDDGLGSSPSGPRRSGRHRPSGDPGDDETPGGIEESVHPFAGSSPGSSKPIDAFRIGLDRLDFILSGEAGDHFSSHSFQKRLDFVNVPDEFVETHFLTERARNRALPRTIPPPPKSHRRTLAQIREWYRFGHASRDAIIAKESRIRINTEFDDASRWLGRWNSEGGWVEGEGWLDVEQGHPPLEVVYEHGDDGNVPLEVADNPANN